jgi:predicted transcriptional regulator
MARKKSATLTDAEHRIMEIVWRKGSATVADVVEALEGKDGTAYTTILTMMRILRAKDICRAAKRARTSSPESNRETAARKASDRCSQNFSLVRPASCLEFPSRRGDQPR